MTDRPLTAADRAALARAVETGLRVIALSKTVKTGDKTEWRAFDHATVEHERALLSIPAATLARLGVAGDGGAARGEGAEGLE